MRQGAVVWQKCRYRHTDRQADTDSKADYARVLPVSVFVYTGVRSYTYTRSCTHTRVLSRCNGRFTQCHTRAATPATRTHTENRTRPAPTTVAPRIVSTGGFLQSDQPSIRKHHRVLHQRNMCMHVCRVRARTIL